MKIGALEGLDSALSTRDAGMQTSTFRAMAGLVILLALITRVAYVSTAIVDYPIRGDVNAYVLHAWNLVHRGEFSTQMPQGDTVVQEDHRGPGYPLVLALAMVVAGHSELPLREGPEGWAVLGFSSDTWMQYVYAIQVVLGTLTVLLTISIARFWLNRRAALTAGLLIALWPHLVVSTGALYAEAVFTFSVALSLYTIFLALAARNVRTAAAAGICFGIACCINPVIAIFAIVIAILMWRTSTIRCAAVFMAAVSIFPLVCTVSVSNEFSGLQARASGPFVVGSWPQFYEAYYSRLSDDESARIVAAANQEGKVFDQNPALGLRMMMDRMTLHPVQYLRWYVLSKPYLLWDWAIRIGSGDIYTVETRNSPYEKNSFLRASASIYETLNPLFFFSALIASIFVVINFFRSKRESQFAVFGVAGLFLYVTIVYSILQAEPRYSIPFRPYEVLLSVTLVTQLWRAVTSFRSRSAGISKGLSL